MTIENFVDYIYRNKMWITLLCKCKQVIVKPKYVCYFQITKKVENTHGTTHKIYIGYYVNTILVEGTKHMGKTKNKRKE